MIVGARDTVKDLAYSYGPLALVAVIFLIMTTVVSPIDREEQRLTSTTTTEEGTTIASGPGSTRTTAGTSSAGRNVAGFGFVPAGGDPCTDRTKQVPGDSYSPPCYVMVGNNGGATSLGVTPTEITVSVREVEDFNLPELFAELSNQEIRETNESIRNTISTLADYFNKRFQFWGRKIKIKFYKGQGAAFSEFLGGGKEKALADGAKAAKEVKAFADVSGITIPYADALAQQKVVNIGAPYPSRRWFERRRPYSWSTFTDGTAVVEAAANWTTKRLRNKPVCCAGDEYNGRPRKYAALAPENAEYQESVNALLERMNKAGMKVDLNVKYKIDVNSMPNQASNIVAQLKDAGITSILCGCDPIMLAVGLSPKSNEQNYFPEWLTAGLAFVDQDIVAQLIDGRQWKHAFGIAYNAQNERLGASYAYNAYKAVQPNDEPAFGVEIYYAQLYVLAIGLHMAGPNLTPESFEAGMFNYPGGTGPLGSWAFDPGDWTTTDDFREVWWDPERTSPQNGQPGAWVELNGGKRYFPDQLYEGDAPYFK